MEAYPVEEFQYGFNGSRRTKSKMGRNSNGSSVSRSKEEMSQSHKEAERRRRQRINAHLSTLRSLLPETTKADKASLLSEVVHRLRELRRQAADAALDRDFHDRSGPFPGETNQTAVSCDEGLLKATISCEDRPDLNRDLVRAIDSAGLKPIRAEMATVDGRTGIYIVMKWTGNRQDDVGLLKQALDEVVHNRVSGFGMNR